MRRSSLLFALCILALCAAALAIRLPRLGLRPMHCDEANQAVKAGILAGNRGQYRYDPHEHHGPSLYWLTLPSLRLSGATDFAQTDEADYRIVPVVFGAGLIVLLLLVADGLGRGPALWAGAADGHLAGHGLLLALLHPGNAAGLLHASPRSPAAGAAFRSRSIGWAIAAGASLGLMHATKETWILAAAAMVAGVVLAAVWTRNAPLARGPRQGPTSPLAREAGEGPGVRACVRSPRSCAAAICRVCRLGRALQLVRHRLARPARFDPRLRHVFPPRQRRRASTITRGTTISSCSPGFRPARGFFWTEGLIVGLAAVGFVRFTGPATGHSRRSSSGSAPASPPSARFLAFYTLVLTIVYAAIPYKTPWCLLSFLHGMMLLAGVGAWAVIRWPSVAWAEAPHAARSSSPASVHLGWESYWLNFRLSADQRNPYVYAHTSSDVLNLAAQMERLARVAPEGHEMTDPRRHARELLAAAVVLAATEPESRGLLARRRRLVARDGWVSAAERDPAHSGRPAGRRRPPPRRLFQADDLRPSSGNPDFRLRARRPLAGLHRRGAEVTRAACTAHSQPAVVATYSVPLAATGEASTLAPRLMRLSTFNSLPAASTQRPFEVGM